MWMPLYIADYLADTAYLTTEQSGAYLHLLMAYWRNGPPPDNDAILASITKLPPDSWRNARPMLEAFFEVLDGVWLHKRVEKEMTKAEKNRNSAHDRAVKAAMARWGNKENAPSMNEALPEDMPEQCPSPSPSPTPLQPPAPPQIKASRTPRATRLPEDWKLPVEWAEWTIANTPSVNPITEAEKFRDYWVSLSGSKATKNSWDGTWRNWCRRAESNGHPRQFLTTTQRIQQNNEQAIADFLSDSGVIDHDQN